MLEKSKSLTPYPCVQVSKSTYEFVADSGVIYEVYFTSGKKYFPEASFAEHTRLLNIYPKNRLAPLAALDARMGPTLASIIGGWLDEDEATVIMYVCDDEDQREAKRQARFMRWFDQYNEGDRLVKIELKAKGVAGAVFYERGNPAAGEIRKANKKLISKLG